MIVYMTYFGLILMDTDLELSTKQYTTTPVNSGVTTVI